MAIIFGYTSLRVWLKFINWARKHILLLRGTNFSDQYKYLILKNLAQNDVLEYYKEPHTLEAFIKDFQLVNDDYFEYILNLLIKGKILLKNENNECKLNTDSKDQVLNYILGYDDPKEIPDKIPSFIVPADFLKDLNEVFLEFGDAVFPRLQGNAQEFTGGVQLFNWDSAFTISLYRTGRDCALYMAKAKKLKNSRVLDVGCGNGFGTADIWGRLHPRGNEIIGIDNSDDLLAIAQEKAEFTRWLKMQGYTPSNEDLFPTFLKANAEELPFPDEHFDLVHMSLVIHWLINPQKAIKEVARVLKPGGKVCGTQGSLQPVAEWLDALLRTVEGTGGHRPEKELRSFFTNAGLSIARRTAAGFFCGVKPK